MCQVPSAEAEDLECTACYPDEQNARYICNCLPIPSYLNCKDALDNGQTESGVYKLNPGNQPAFEVMKLPFFVTIAQIDQIEIHFTFTVA